MPKSMFIALMSKRSSTFFFFFLKVTSNQHQSLLYQALCWTLESDMKDTTLVWINIFFKKIDLFICLSTPGLSCGHEIISCSTQV